jgi:nitrate reductase gamma subunit
MQWFNHMLHEVLFGLYPYFAGIVMVLGAVIRFDREQYSWRSGSSQMLRTRSFRLASNLFHFGILFLIVGHIVGLLTPAPLYHALGLSTTGKQLIAMTAGGAAGVICFIGLTMLIQRRLFDARIRATSSFSDIFILLMLYVQLILGLLTIGVSALHMDGSQMVLLAEWAQRIVTFRPHAADQLLSVNWLYKLHLLVGLSIILVFPFTRLVHIISAPIWYLGRSYQIVRSRR